MSKHCFGFISGARKTKIWGEFLDGVKSTHCVKDVIQSNGLECSHFLGYDFNMHCLGKGTVRHRFVWQLWLFIAHTISFCVF